jgi:hypothetical protein
MKLRDLEARFLLYLGPRSHREIETFAEADGIAFLCPKCFARNGGAIGTHTVICWFEGRVPAEAVPGPGRWAPEGTGLDDLTFAGPRASSVRITGGCRWHGYVRAGDVR